MFTYCEIQITISSNESNSIEEKEKKLRETQKVLDTHKYRKLVFKAAYPNSKYLKVRKQPILLYSESDHLLTFGWIYWGSTDIEYKAEISEKINGCEVKFNLTPFSEWKLKS